MTRRRAISAGSACSSPTCDVVTRQFPCIRSRSDGTAFGCSGWQTDGPSGWPAIRVQQDKAETMNSNSPARDRAATPNAAFPVKQSTACFPMVFMVATCDERRSWVFAYQGDPQLVCQSANGVPSAAPPDL